MSRLALKKKNKEKNPMPEITPEALPREEAPKRGIPRKLKIVLIVIVSLLLVAAAGFVSYLKYQEHLKKIEAQAIMLNKYKAQFTAREIDQIDENSYYAYLTANDIEGSLVKAKIPGTGAAIEDNYPAVRLSHLISDDFSEKLQNEDYLFVHTDNALENSNLGEFEADTISISEYLAANPEDSFNICILINSDKASADLLRNTIGAAAYTLEIERGSLTVYAFPEDEFENLTSKITKRDSANIEAAKEAFKETEPVLTLDLSEVYEETHDVKDKDNNKND